MASVYSYYTYLAFRVLAPLKGLQLLNIIFGQHFREKYVQHNRKINFLMRLIELYKPYLFLKAVFDDMNTVKLQLAVMEGGAGADADVFYFDPNSINWEDLLHQNSYSWSR
ncbi:Fatty acyl-CoA reductase, C-terminal [Dillenia turbinata]|uniref:Fatty acyl-CoA reductase, C-terminal n=1 Tax=Dillenia turbinata TaxID=194707 RepID=A0AAN8ZJC3_9MAGN